MRNDDHGSTRGVPVEYRMLGPLTALRDGSPVPLGGPRQRAVLAVLLLAAGRAVDSDTLIDRVWEDDAPAKPLTSLRAYLANLRRELGDDALFRDGSGYCLRLDGDQVDTRQFATLVERGHGLAERGDLTAAKSAFESALDLWRGEPLVDFRDMTFAAGEVHRLTALRVDAVESRYDAALRLGHHAESIAGLESEVAANPLREKLWHQLMVAQYRAGRRSDSLRTYARVREVLDAELGVTPGAALERLATDVRNEAPALDWQPPAAEAPVGRTARPYELFGRTTEVVRLRQSLTAACGGRGGVVVVSGDSGMGKTALAQHVATVADELGMATVWAGHAPEVRRPPSWAWAHAVRTLAGQLPRDTDSPTHALLPEWWRVATERLNAGEALLGNGFDVFEATTAALQDLAAHRPALIVLDDLQRADRFTLEALEHLACNAHRMPLSILATWQEGADDDSVGIRGLERLRSRTDVEFIRLRPLDLAATAALIADTGGGEAAPDFTAGVHRRTGGNPFFVRELVRLLADAGRFGDANLAADEGVPEAVSGVLNRRMAAFSAASRNALAAAAVLGAEFHPARLAAAVAIPVADVNEALSPALKAGLIVATPGQPELLRFGHGLVRDAIAGELTGNERAGLHADIAKAFASAPDAVTAQDAIDGAEHAWRAGTELDADVALQLLDRARAEAWGRSAYREVAELDRRALASCARLPNGPSRFDREMDLQMQLASVEAVVTGQSSAEVLTDLRRSTGEGHDALQSTIAVAMGCLEACGTGRYYDATLLSDGLIEFFDATNDALAGAAGFYIRALTEFMRGHLDVALASVRRLQCDVPPVDPAFGALASFEVLAHGVGAHAHGLRGESDEAHALLAAGIAEGTARGDAFGTAVLRMADIQLSAMLGAPDGVGDKAEAVVRELTELGVDQFIGGARVVRAWAQAVGPDATDTVDEMRAALDLHGQGGRRIFSPLYLGLLSDAVARHRNPGDARDLLGQAESLAGVTGERVWDAQLSARRLKLAARARTITRDPEHGDVPSPHTSSRSVSADRS